MNNRLRFALIGIGALLVAAVFTFPLWQHFLVNKSVTQVFPGLSPDQQTAFVLLSPTQQRAYQQLIPTDATMAVSMAQAALSTDVVVPTEQQPLPPMTDPVVAATGAFTQIDPIHGASGSVTVYQLPDNSHVLRFEDFRSTNGPDLHVIMTQNPDPRTPADVGQNYIELGPLKGNVGNQSYTVPSEVDLSEYQGVVIYSLTFRTVFSTAKLKLS